MGKLTLAERLRYWLHWRIRELGYRLHLIRYCVLCDGSWVQAEARGYGFTPDRWVWHRRHDVNEQAHRGR